MGLYLFTLPRRLAGCGAAGFALVFFAQGAANAELSFSASPATTILTTADMNGFGLMVPDTPMGFIKSGPAGTYDVFTAGGSFSGVGSAAHLPNGTYKFTGTFDHLRPAASGGLWPRSALAAGKFQASPDGSDFDRDYGGGGLTYEITVPGKGSQPPRAALLQIYHGEYHFTPADGLRAYGGSGLAVSYDGGATFTKLGMILTPHVSRDEYLKAGIKGGLWSDAAMVEADAAGHVDEKTLGKPIQADGGDYLYFVFTERNSADEIGNDISLARVATADLLVAVADGKAPNVSKYYNPSGAPGVDAAQFSQPGAGGISTPIVDTAREGINSPDIDYDPSIRKYVLSYQKNQKFLMLRTSGDLRTWSAPQAVVSLPLDSDQRLYSPTIVGKGGSPAVLGDSFYIYYLQRTKVGRRLVEPRLQRVEVSVKGN